MPLIPDAPFPKAAGDAVRSKDWNDLVTETQRLDTAKVNRAGDAISGSLTIAAALGIKTAAPKAPLHVVGAALVSTGDGYAVPNNFMSSGSLTIGSTTASFGGGTGWNANTAGLLLETLADTEIAVRGTGNKLASVARYQSAPNTLTFGRDMGSGAITTMVLNGNVGIGVAAPGLRMDVADRIRLRQGASGNAGLMLFQSLSNADRAFIGMINENTVGVVGTTAGASLTTDVLNGNVGVRITPVSNVALYVNGTSQNYGLYVNGNSYCTGRMTDQKLRLNTTSTSLVNTTSTAWVDIPQMSQLLAPTIGAYFLILVQINGVQALTAPGTVATIGADFRLLIDGGQVDFTRQEFHNNGWELRGITLTTVIFLSAASHTISVQWLTTSGTLTCCWYGDCRRILTIEL